jgi:hypothetical protein
MSGIAVQAGVPAMKESRPKNDSCRRGERAFLETGSSVRYKKVIVHAILSRVV